MALTADQKEAIMAARGKSAAPVSKSKTRRYELSFSDGKRATALDMEGNPEADQIRSMTAMFRPGYVTSITPM